MAPAAIEDAQLGYTDLEDIVEINEHLHKVFLTGKTRNLEYRKNQLKQLTYLLLENRQEFTNALVKDLGRPQFESEFAELIAMVNDCIEAVENLDKWAATETKWAGLSFATHKCTVRKDPKGTVLILGAWNYPLGVQIGPTIAAIAAGNTYVMKPSEIAAHTAKLIADLWPRYMDPDTGRIVTGGIPQSTALLDLRWEHIFYTGNGTVGRIISEKAAKWLCPVTLELGGKSPTWVDEHCNLDIAAHRILWAKTINNGQTCIAPDYIVCPAAFQPKLVAALKKVLAEFYPSSKGGVAKSDSYARIINEGHWKRIDGLLNNTSGKVIEGGKGRDVSQKLMPPTIVSDCKFDDSLMTGEIFGPLLPIVPVSNVDEAISFINSRDQPLALYIFSNDATAQKIIENTRSGAVVVGDLLLQFAITSLPFGGTGPSGYGNYHGEYGFKAFTHERATVYAPDKGIMGRIVEKAMAPRYPPYGKNAVTYFTHLIAKSVPYSKPKNPHAAVRPRRSTLRSKLSLLLTLLAIVFGARQLGYLPL